eukprot:11537796-Karenia_brevis.AAC.1
MLDKFWQWDPADQNTRFAWYFKRQLATISFVIFSTNGISTEIWNALRVTLRHLEEDSHTMMATGAIPSKFTA